MASNDFPHGQATVLFKFTPADYGPCNALEGAHYNNFTGGNYYMVTPKENYVRLYRLHGGNAGPEGQYWTYEPRQGNEAYRYDAAVLRQWNSLEESATLVVPKGVHMYEGSVGQQGHYFGGGWQVFIPREVVQRLVKIQQNPTNQFLVDREIKAIETFQKESIGKWENEMNKRLESQAFQYGSNLRNLPQNVREFLNNRSGESSNTNIRPGEYIIHRDSIPKPGGGRRNISVSVRVEFVRSETRTYQSGRTNVNETTNYYNRITTIADS